MSFSDIEIMRANPAGNRVTLVMRRKENHNEILFMVYTL